MRVIGIDPGYDRCGIAVVEHKNTKDTLIASECVETDSEMVFAQRLTKVGKRFEYYIKTYVPDMCAIEAVYFNTNQKTATKIGNIVGACMYIAEQAGIPTREFSPTEVKVATTGYGKSSKEQVMAMIPQLLSFEKDSARDDEFDAIAVALTGLHTN